MDTHDERQKRVILADPTDSLAQNIADAFVAEGFAVSPVDSASECLSHIEHSAINGVVSRYEFPEFDGIHLLRSIRIAHPSLPFVLHPREGSEKIAGEAIAAGVNGYVPDDSAPRTVVSRLQNSADEAGSSLNHESHDRYRHLVDVSPVPINLFDSDGTIIWGNNAVIELLGLDGREDLIGRSIFEFIHPDDEAQARAELEAVISQKSAAGPTSMRLSPPDGDVRYISVATAIGEFLGTDIGQAVIINITDKIEREHHLKILDTWLRHNIRNNLTLINGLADEIEFELADDVRETAREIKSHTETLVNQADRERQLLDLVTSRPTPAVLDAHQVVSQAIQTSQKEFPSNEIRLTRADEVEIEAIPKLLVALQELIVNGIEHTETESATVEVQIIRQSDDIGKIQIADNGPGIPQQELEVLNPESEIDQLNHGSGLGLVFVWWVIQLSEGTLSFEENDPKGTVVTLKLQTSDE